MATSKRFSLARSLLVGGVLCCLIPLMSHVSVGLVHASYMSIDFMPMGAVFVFFALVLLGNTVARAVRRDWALTRPELLVVYTGIGAAAPRFSPARISTSRLTGVYRG